ncbi:MAG TPA: hypothetical protein VL326_32970, partial [Kofleriaceae bacterium]|nr:hypothetical protein [Kofleriaceae bacterium]
MDVPADKSDDAWWKPERALAPTNTPFTIAANDAGHVVRGTFDANVYAATVFAAQAGTKVPIFTRTWLAEGWSSPWDTEPYVFAWTGAKDASVDDWQNWSMVSHCCNNFEVTLPRTGQYLLVVMTTQTAYAAKADYLAFIPGTDALSGVHGTVRCGATRKPLAGATLSIDTRDEHVQSRSDGAFAFTSSYSAGRHDL